MEKIKPSSNPWNTIYFQGEPIILTGSTKVVRAFMDWACEEPHGPARHDSDWGTQ